jgi:hypothetical protein
VQCHPRGLQNGSIREVGRTWVKQNGCTFSKFGLDITSGEEKGAPRWISLQSIIYSKALRSTIGARVTSKWISLMDFTHWLGPMSLVWFLFPKVNPLFFPSYIWVLIENCNTSWNPCSFFSHNENFEVVVLSLGQFKYHP